MRSAVRPVRNASVDFTVAPGTVELRYNSRNLDPTSSASSASAHSLLTLLADGGSGAAALSLLHQRAMQVTGATSSLLFELHPSLRQMQATSGAGLEHLPTKPWDPTGEEARLVAQAFADRRALAVTDLSRRMPLLHRRLTTGAAILLPLLADTRRVGLVALGTEHVASTHLQRLEQSDVPPGFRLALELSGLRQREEFERDIRHVLDRFSERLASTLDLSAALEPLCAAVTRLFVADRTTVWLHDRESRLLVPLASSDRLLPGESTPVRTDDPIEPAAVALRTNRSGLAAVPGQMTSVLTIPLRGCRRALGTIVFDGVRVEPGEDLTVLMRADELGRQLSSAVETMQLLGVVTRSRRELEQLFASIAHLIVVVDPSLRIVRANHAFAEAVGIPTDSLLHRPLDTCVGPEFMAWLHGLAQPLDDPAMTELTDAVLKGPYIVTATDLHGDGNRHAGRVIVARDLVPVMALREREVLQSRLLQSEKLAALGHFVAGIAHELNNPLQSVMGHLELMRSTGAVPESIRDEVRTVFREADRAARIVRTLMVFAGSGRVQRRKATLKGILQRVLALRKASCRSRGIEVVRHYDEQLPAVHVDSLLLHQVFLHILMNAELAVAATGQPGRIDVTTTTGEPGWVVATIRDTGTGISGDTLPRVFEPFYTTRDVGEGVGLGLALAYGIVQEHGGRISASNHPDGGAVFTVELPIA